MEVPAIHYADTGGLKIAWHEYGEGPDVLAIPPLVSNIELVWEHKYYRRFLEYFAQHLHVVAFDKRGIGLSDRFDRAPTLEERIQDIVAVMDAAGLESATVLGTSEGGLMAQLFTVMHPERVERLILLNSSPGASCLVELDTEADGTMPRLLEKMAKFERLGATWGQDPQFMVDWFSPVRSDDRTFVQWMGRLQRQSATAKELSLQVESLAPLDAVDRLGEISVPTLVAHAIDDPVIPFESAVFLAERVPGAVLVELPGNDHFLFTHPQWQTAIDACIEFVTGRRPRPTRTRNDSGRASFGWDSLTKAEVRVVDLAASGFSNKQIADKLFVSVATVKSHLVHIYQKLEIGTRAELAAAFAAHEP